MAVSVVSYSEDLHVLGWPKRDTRPRRIGLDNAELQRGLRTRIKALVGYWEELRECNVSRRPYSGRLPSWKEALNAKDVTRGDLFKPCGTARPATVPPPTYEESLADSPPDYTETAATAAVCTRSDVKDSADFNGDQKLHPDSSSLPSYFDASEIDGIRSYANKKAKKAAKVAQQAKWADSDNEENNGEGADGGDGGSGGGDGGSGAGGDGGDPPGGGDGGDDDWWNTGNSKKDKKKKKKNAWDVRCFPVGPPVALDAVLTRSQDFEEEEEKKKEEEDAAANAGAANDFDDWGAFTSVGKKKKGKKGAEPDIPPPPPEPVDLGASATADALGDDDWGFSTGKKKKDKKKGKVRSFYFILTVFRFLDDGHM